MDKPKHYRHGNWEALEATRDGAVYMQAFTGGNVNTLVSALYVKTDKGEFDIPFGSFLVKDKEDNWGVFCKSFIEDLNKEKKVSKEDLSAKRKELFQKITKKLYDTYLSKNADYGGSFEEQFAEDGMSYSIMHLREKLNRIKSLQKKSNDVSGESYVDSLEDMANYAILTLIELRLQEKEPQE